MKIVLLNGAPGSGKDTIANYICAVHGDNWVHLQYKHMLKRVVGACLENAIGIAKTENMQSAWADDRALKDSPCPLLNGKTYRDLYIDMAEKILKPYFGKDIFGLQVQRQIEEIYAKNYAKNQACNVNSNVIVSDLGFIEESLPTLNWAQRTGQDVYLIHLYRGDCTFDKDSRGYIPAHLLQAYPQLVCASLSNDSAIATCISSLEGIIGKI